MVEIKFDTKKLDKLNNAARLQLQNPDIFWPLLELTDPETILDIGCGTGFFSVEFLKRAPSAKVFGLDIAPVMLEWIKANRIEFQEDRLIPLLMPEDQLPLEDSIGDLATMINLHHELHNPVGILEECRRTLKPGGTLMILDWKAIKTENGPPLEIRATTQKVQEQLQTVGFTDIQVHDVFEQFFLVTAKCPGA